MLRVKRYILLFLFFTFSIISLSAKNDIKDLRIKTDFAVVKGIESNVRIEVLDSLGEVADFNCFTSIFINDNKTDIYFDNGVAEFDYIFNEKSEIIISSGDIYGTKIVNPIPLWLSILPPLIAIFFALLFKEVYTALFLGIFSGTLIIEIFSGQGIILSIFNAIFSVFDTYIVSALYSKTHISIIIFSMLIGATVNVFTRNGGMRGVINYLSKYANTARSGQLVTWFLGIMIFFDDYANSLVVGNTLRPVTDKLKISREKLAYIVDSTAAPVASIAFVTTWIGAELSYIQSALLSANLDVSSYSIFFMSLKYSFYPIVTLFFVLMIILLKKDYGPMYKAEVRARTKGITSPVVDKKIEHELKEFENVSSKAKAYNALIPILIIIIGTILGLFYTGWDSNTWNDQNISFITKMSIIIGNSDSYISLIRASGLGLIVAVILSISQKIMSLKDSAESILSGFKTMLTAIIILCLAWALAKLIEDLHTADFIIQMLNSSNLKPQYLPILSFIVSALISFSTGTSWGTMAIMYPLILPSSWILFQQYGMDFNSSLEVFAHISATVISGAVFGDHCSPISDTTILSSLSSSCNHIQHVKTQIPYALTVAIITMIFGTFLVENGLNIWIAYLIMFGSIFTVIYFFGKSSDAMAIQTKE